MLYFLTYPKPNPMIKWRHQPNIGIKLFPPGFSKPTPQNPLQRHRQIVAKIRKAPNASDSLQVGLFLSDAGKLPANLPLIIPAAVTRTSTDIQFSLILLPCYPHCQDKNQRGKFLAPASLNRGTLSRSCLLWP